MKKILIGALMLISASSFAQKQEYEIVYKYDSTQNVSINTDNTEETNVENAIDCYVPVPSTIKKLKALTYDIRKNKILIYAISNKEPNSVEGIISVKRKEYVDTENNEVLLLTFADGTAVLNLTEKWRSRLNDDKGYDLQKLEGFKILKKMYPRLTLPITTCEYRDQFH
jgi:hypothetical protein